jgi:hypothetical protein
VAVQLTAVGTAITADPVASVDPVTTAASVGPVTMAEATTAEAAATAKPLPAQVTVAAPRPSLLCVMPTAELSSAGRGLIPKP